MPKVSVLIEGDKDDNAPVPVSVNGKTIEIQRDEWTEISEEQMYVLTGSGITFRLKDEPPGEPEAEVGAVPAVFSKKARKAISKVVKGIHDDSKSKSKED